MSKERILEYLKANPERLGRAVEVIAAIPRIKVENPQFLQEAQEWLNVSSIIINAGPHLLTWDLPIIERVKAQFFDFEAGENAWPASAKFFGYDCVPKMSESERKAFLAYSERRGITLYPVVQSYLITDDNKDQAEAINRGASKKLIKTVRKPGNIVSMFTEESRGETGGLLRPKVDILGGLTRKSPSKIPPEALPPKVIPLLLIGIDRMQKGRDTSGLSGLNPLVSITLRAGFPLGYEQAEEYAAQFRWTQEAIQKYKWQERGFSTKFTITDAHMLHLANYSPPTRYHGANPRGVYAWENIELAEK